jgi:hypothetical protein
VKEVYYNNNNYYDYETGQGLTQLEKELAIINWDIYIPKCVGGKII